ncbi:MAG: DUF6252 family protein [Gelidibacter sp.]
MKKIALLFLTLLTLWNCGDEVEFNTPGFQGNKNYNLWRATYFGATSDNSGVISIVAGRNSEKMTLVLNSGAVGTHLLSETSVSKADFTDFENFEYSTSNPPDPSVSLYPEGGEIVITESTPNYLTGTFRFIAFTADGLNSVGFNEGDFYRIPINSGAGSGSAVSCQQATNSLATAQANYVEVMPGDDEYAARCNAYKAALQQVVVSCGDPGGTFQAIIDGLGDCN